MKIEHIGLWVKDLEKMREFYEKYFEASAGELYHNEKKSFRSYFLTFPDGDTRLELMNKPQLVPIIEEAFGYAHIAYQVEDKQAVDQLHNRLVGDGYKHVDGPRTTGDGYYEAVIEDPEGNLVEITA
jgi:lactoylglutathione lyase